MTFDRSKLVFATAMASNGESEDRIAVIEREDVLVVVLADGAGGMQGGATAADTFLTAVRARLAMPIDPYDMRAWSELFAATDASLHDVLGGETTAIIVVVGESGIAGVSVGDSEAWIVSGASIDRLTSTQDRRRIGSGRAKPVVFHRRALEGTLVVGSDGLFKYVKPASIASCCQGSDVANALVTQPKLASGDYPDDVCVAVVTL